MSQYKQYNFINCKAVSTDLLNRSLKSNPENT